MGNGQSQCDVTVVRVSWILPEATGRILEEVTELRLDPWELHRAVSTWRSSGPDVQTKSDPPSALTQAPVT